MKKYAILFLLLFLAHTAQAGSVERFVFVGGGETVKPNQSMQVVVQSQDGAGNVTPILETTSLSFVSSSPTGQFVSVTGKRIATSTTMSKNTANRSVYYMDSSVGDFQITLTATGRTSKQTFVATERITVATTTVKIPVTAVTSTSTTQNTLHTATTTPKTPQKIQATLPTSTTSVTGTSTAVFQTTDLSQAVFVAPQHTDFLHRIFAWPILAADAVYHFFFGEESGRIAIMSY